MIFFIAMNHGHPLMDVQISNQLMNEHNRSSERRDSRSSQGSGERVRRRRRVMKQKWDSRGEQVEREPRGWTPFARWAVLLFSLFIVFAAITLWWHGQNKPAAVVLKQQTQQKIIESAPKEEQYWDPGKAEDWKGALPAQVAEYFTKAKTHAERLKWVREPAVVDGIMQDFFQNGPGKTEQVRKITSIGGVSSGGAAYDRFTATMTDGTTRQVNVVLSEQVAKVDFKSYIAYSSCNWNDLLEGKIKHQVELRMTVKNGNYYNFDYVDEQKYQCYIGISPVDDNPCYFYCLRDSLDHVKMQELTEQGFARATVEIVVQGEGYKRRQFMIQRFLAAGWVVPNL